MWVRMRKPGSFARLRRGRESVLASLKGELEEDAQELGVGRRLRELGAAASKRVSEAKVGRRRGEVDGPELEAGLWVGP